MKLQTLSYQKDKWSDEFNADLDSDNTFILIFCNHHFSKIDVLNQIQNNYPKSTLIGCSTAGEIFNDTVLDESVVVSICKLENSKIKLFSTQNIESISSYESGCKVVQDLSAQDLKAILVLTEGLNLNGSSFSQGINDSLKKNNIDIKVLGGMSADGADFKKTFQILNSKIVENCVIALGLYGDSIDVVTSSFVGWESFGKLRKVTKSIDNVLYEIDSIPALDVYKKFLGKDVDKLPSSALYYPLSLYDSNQKKSLVRTVLAIDENKKTMTFAGNIPEGSVVQLMLTQSDSLLDSASQAADEVLACAEYSTEVLAIAISCVGRKLVLGKFVDDETNIVYKKLPQNSRLIGFYSYGEFSKYADRPCELHNQTMTLSLLKEK